MKKHFLKISIFIVIVFLFGPITVKANFGDLRYEILNVKISDSSITFEGWAYIHRTNNYITVEASDGSIIKKDGGQDVLIEAYADGVKIDEQTNSLDEDKMFNYNFYCELFTTSSNRKCSESNYKSATENSCRNRSDGVGYDTSSCYYEDIYFKITFDTSKWNVSETSKVNFKIAVTNNDYKAKKGCKDCYTNSEIVSIAEASVSNFSNDYIIIDKSSLSTKVEFIASKGLLLSPISNSTYFEYPSGADCTWGTWKTNNGDAAGCGTNIYELYTDKKYNYSGGRSNNTDNSRCFKFLGPDCQGTHNYALKVKTTHTNNGYVCSFACPADTSDYKVAVARGSHVKPTGSFKITVKNDKKCDVDSPSIDHLYCNSSGTLSSTCNELTVHTKEGSATVKIEEKGTISSVLTPEKIYAGGGFNFGIMYYNTIKWSYVNSVPNSTLHNLVTAEMNKKLKEYNEYISGLNITELKIGNKNYDSSFLAKKCTTSDSKSNYYNKELTVSCVFYFPESDILQDGNVDYKYGFEGLGINNKYYTALDDKGKYKIEAKIVGMDRITDSASKSDSKVDGKKWTGTWEDTFEKCEIDVYSLIICPNCNDRYKFIYRPIDINNPFPNRNPGINWFDWYNIEKNKERLENSYSKLQYVAALDNNAIADIKKYNKDHNYLDWDSINKVTGESSFIREKNYIDRVGGIS